MDPWTSVESVTGCDRCSALQDVDIDLEEYVAVASELLAQLTGGRFGIWTETVMPASRNYWCEPSPYRRRINVGGVSRPALRLGYFPIRSVLEVKIGGITLPNSAVAVVDHDWVVRTDDGDWPKDNSNWTIKFTYGEEPDAAAIAAADALVCELALACVNPSKCSLPKNVTQVTRQGLTAVLADPFAMLDNGRTGVYEVDLLLMAYPQVSPAQVYIPGVEPPSRRVTWRSS